LFRRPNVLPDNEVSQDVKSRQTEKVIDEIKIQHGRTKYRYRRQNKK